MPQRHSETADLSLDDFRSVAARDDDPDAHDVVAAEESLHAVDPFVDPELLEASEAVEAIDVDAIAASVAAGRTRVATEAADQIDEQAEDLGDDEDDDVDHEAGVDEILDETTHSHDPAREVGWADDEPDDASTSPAAVPPDPGRHPGEFVCGTCFLVLNERLRSDEDPTRCRECAAVPA